MTGADRQDAPKPMPAVGLVADLAGGLTGAGSPGAGLAWSWELDVEALLAAVSDPAPWNRHLRGSPSQPVTAAPTPDAASADPAPEDGPVPEAAAPEAAAPEAAVPEAAVPDVLASGVLASDASAPALDDADMELAEYLDAVEAGRSQVLPLPVVAGRIAESLCTGPELAGWLAAGSVTDLEDGALAGMASSYRRLASWAQAGELSVVAELASRSAAANERIGVDAQGRPARLTDDTCAEVSLALTMSQVSASWWVDLGVTLQWRLAATGAALRAGAIDLGRARAIAEATALLDDKTARVVEARMLADAGAKTMAQLRAALRRAVISADPQGAERRREQAERQAKVVLYPEAEGTASLAGYNLPGVRAAAAMARISALAQALKASGAGGGIDLLRAQVLLGLVLGTLPYIPPPADGPPDPAPPGDNPPDEEPPAAEPPADGSSGGGSPDVAATDDGPSGGGPRDGLPCGWAAWEADADGVGARPPPAWPEVLPLLQPGPAAMGNLSPAAGGLLDLRLPWATLTGRSLEPGYLGRLGPITSTQASYLADLAARDPAVRWRVIVTDLDGRAVAVARVPGAPGQSARAGAQVRTGGATPAQARAGLVGQVTVVIGRECLAEPQEMVSLAPAAVRVLAAARSAAARAPADVSGKCAHADATAAYRPTRKLWEYVTARDLTCRFLTCRQPAMRCDLDHTVPFDQGGPTCSCNLGGVCRCHHQIKQRPGWRLDQVTPGTFVWTTPTGRTYIVRPDSHAA